MDQFERAMEAYDRVGRHSDGILAVMKECRRVTITPVMLSEAKYELGSGHSDNQVWRILACALRAGGFEVTDEEATE